jgi:hypothetical protein
MCTNKKQNFVIGFDAARLYGRKNVLDLVRKIFVAVGDGAVRCVPCLESTIELAENPTSQELRGLLVRVAANPSRAP